MSWENGGLQADLVFTAALFLFLHFDFPSLQKKIMEVDLGGLFKQNSTFDYDNYEYEDDEQKRSVSVLITVLYSVVLVAGLLGNALLLVILVQKRRNWRISDTFILHLGVADTLLLATLPFWAVQEAQPSGWCFGTVFCKICGALFNVSTEISVEQRLKVKGRLWGGIGLL